MDWSDEDEEGGDGPADSLELPKAPEQPEAAQLNGGGSEATEEEKPKGMNYQ